MLGCRDSNSNFMTSQNIYFSSLVILSIVFTPFSQSKLISCQDISESGYGKLLDGGDNARSSIDFPALPSPLLLIGD